MQAPSGNAAWFDEQGKVDADDPASVLVELIKKTISDYPVDPDRVYLSGVSAGGSVCWELGIRHPELFAAIAPLAGNGCGTDKKRLSRLKDIPIWAFPSRHDPLTSPEGVRQTVLALDQLGGRVALTEIDDHYHDCWTAAFRDYRLKDWMLIQRRGQRRQFYPPGRRPISWQLLGGIVIGGTIVLTAIRRELRRARTTENPANEKKVDENKNE